MTTTAKPSESYETLCMKDEIRVTLNPEERMKKLIASSNLIQQIKPDVPVCRLLRSLLELQRLANVYYEDIREKDYERAFNFYLRFMAIFCDVLPKHPGFKECKLPEKNKVIKAFGDCETRAKDVKKRLAGIYAKEAEQLKLQLENQKKREEERRKQLGNTNQVIPTAPQPLPSLDFLEEKKKASKKTVMLLSPHLISEFAFYAKENTDANRETCGQLFGRLNRSGSKDEFVVSHLLIPKQMGTSESCETTNEEDMYEYQEKHGLISLGWIHTHPSQSAFLSSIDLHMQNTFQGLLDEFIAIVYSPSEQKSGVYTLTPHGRQVLSACRESHTKHHVHENAERLYEEASHHIYISDRNYEIVDFRA
ncbi:hypothetical protein L596_014203 [Steinernema carpocapsae]|uniref:MPN domain-containing protein n=1 Tax=Steinernema carpocapsae TaxID=34508 RepID=A0A4U5NC18_STECR|nr:hypothetical protein L596_014203 [Steinernema carpocapsae]